MPGLSQWDALSGDIAISDLFAITDVGDTTQSVNGSSKKVTLKQLIQSMCKLLQNVSGTSGTIGLSCDLYHTFVLGSLTGATTFTFDNMVDGQTIVIVLDASGETITWPTEVDWPDGTAPDLTDGGTDRLVFQKLSSTVIHGSVAGQAYA